jgi:hypothetical protein
MSDGGQRGTPVLGVDREKPGSFALFEGVRRDARAQMAFDVRLVNDLRVDREQGSRARMPEADRDEVSRVVIGELVAADGDVTDRQAAERPAPHTDVRTRAREPARSGRVRRVRTRPNRQGPPGAGDANAPQTSHCVPRSRAAPPSPRSTAPSAAQRPSLQPRHGSRLAAEQDRAIVARPPHGIHPARRQRGSIPYRRCGGGAPGAIDDLCSTESFRRLLFGGPSVAPLF